MTEYPISYEGSIPGEYRCPECNNWLGHGTPHGTPNLRCCGNCKLIFEAVPTGCVFDIPGGKMRISEFAQVTIGPRKKIMEDEQCHICHGDPNKMPFCSAAHARADYPTDESGQYVPPIGEEIHVPDMRQDVTDAILKGFGIAIKNMTGMDYVPGLSAETLREWIDRTVDHEVKPLQLKLEMAERQAKMNIEDAKELLSDLDKKNREIFSLEQSLEASRATTQMVRERFAAVFREGDEVKISGHEDVLEVVRRDEEDPAYIHVSQMFPSWHAENLVLVRRVEEIELDHQEKSAEGARKQMSLNVDWLIGKFDEVHRMICHGESGTWQQRVEQVVSKISFLQGFSPRKEAEDGNWDEDPPVTEGYERFPKKGWIPPCQIAEDDVVTLSGDGEKLCWQTGLSGYRAGYDFALKVGSLAWKLTKELQSKNWER